MSCRQPFHVLTQENGASRLRQISVSLVTPTERNGISSPVCDLSSIRIECIEFLKTLRNSKLSNPTVFCSMF